MAATSMQAGELRMRPLAGYGIRYEAVGGVSPLYAADPDAADYWLGAGSYEKLADGWAAAPTGVFACIPSEYFLDYRHGGTDYTLALELDGSGWVYGFEVAEPGAGEYVSAPQVFAPDPIPADVFRAVDGYRRHLIPLSLDTSNGDGLMEWSIEADEGVRVRMGVYPGAYRSNYFIPWHDGDARSVSWSERDGALHITAEEGE